MLSRLFAIPPRHPQGVLVAVFSAATVASLWAAIALEAWWIAGLPLALAVAWLATVDFGKIFWLLLASIPLSTEVELPGGLSTDLPSEPLMWVLLGTGTIWLLRHWTSVDARFIRHPITLVLLAHLGWMLVTVITSADAMVSIKFILAKIWYVAVFYFLAGHLLGTEKSFKSFLWWFFLPLLFTVSVVLFRHALIDFSFDLVYSVMGPFYRNHVMYACLMAVFLPFMWFATYWYRRGSAPWWLLVGGIALFIVGINFAYTRAAYIALVAAIGIYWLVRWRLLGYGLSAFAAVLILFMAFLNTKDYWLEFAPEYEKTITHTRFENLIQATTKLEDISTMERVYRWVAASYMIKERPIAGFGPGNFYFNYKDYTVSSFKTYVSDNPERSGIHNYYLMTAVEQGLPGLLLFLAFCFVVMFKGQQLYHRMRSAWKRRMIASALLCFILIALLMLMNDFVETDKIGSLFFLSAAMLVTLDLGNRRAG
jgi:O-antigen ligase